MGLGTHVTNTYLHVFRKDQLAALYAQRAGQCKACGRCCDPLHLPFNIRIRCPLLNPVTKECRVYDSPWRPLVCRLAPTFQTKEEEDRHRALDCGFYRARDENP